MVWAKILAVAVIALMAALGLNIVVHDGLNEGLGMDRFLDGLSDPWRTFIGFDMMTGLLLMAGWIVYRQKGERLLETIAWVLCINWWGNIVVGAYILVAAAQSGGDAAKFFMGARAGPLTPVWAPVGLAKRIACLVLAVAVAGFALSKIGELGLSALPGQAYLPAFIPVVLALVLLAFPTASRIPATAA